MKVGPIISIGWLGEIESYVGGKIFQNRNQAVIRTDFPNSVCRCDFSILRYVNKRISEWVLVQIKGAYENENLRQK